MAYILALDPRFCEFKSRLGYHLFTGEDMKRKKIVIKGKPVTAKEAAKKLGVSKKDLKKIKKIVDKVLKGEF